MNFHALARIDRRVIYTLLVVVVLIPLIRPFGLPLALAEETVKVYEQIEQLGEGDVVFMTAHVNPGTEAETLPQAIAVLRHMMGKGVKIVIGSLFPDGMMYGQRLIGDLAPEYGYAYGEDIVLMGFKAGGETVLTGIIEDFKGIYNNDYEGTPADSLPILDGINELTDFALFVEISQTDSTRWAVRHVATAGVPLVGFLTAVFTPQLMPFYASGQLKGVVSGLSGAAMYEGLIGAPGKATAAMDAQSGGHALIFLAVVVGNIGHYLSRRKGGSHGVK